jgi:membrane-bound lytic murein transglycosylase A
LNSGQSGIKAVLLVLVLMTGTFIGCAGKPLLALSEPSSLSFTDDLDCKGLVPAVASSLEYLCGLPPEKQVPFGDRTIDAYRLAQSLAAFLSLVEKNLADDEMDRRIRENFDIYQARGTGGFNPGRHMLVTGYFHPVLEGSLTRTPPYIYPLYAIPDDLVFQTSPRGEKIPGRIRDGTFVPYWTRREIEQQGKAAGHELVWLKDPFDAFVLHVQGSGLLELRDGSVRGVRFAAKNGREYRSIGRYLVDTGRLQLADASLDTIRAYIAAHPEEREDVLYHNESFIFFSWAENLNPVGNIGRELTPGRSAAIDQSFFPAGSLAFLTARKPSINGDNEIRWTPLHRFVLVQDTGSAMRGPGRVDLFWGTGPAAGSEAGLMKEKGALYVLLIKDKASLNNAFPCSAAPGTE